MAGEGGSSRKSTAEAAASSLLLERTQEQLPEYTRERIQSINVFLD